MIRIVNQFIRLKDILHVEFIGNSAKVTLAKGGYLKEIVFTDADADYLKSVLDACHLITATKLRNKIK